MKFQNYIKKIEKEFSRILRDIYIKYILRIRYYY